MLMLKSIYKKIVGTLIYTFFLFTTTCWLTTGCNHQMGFDDEVPKDADTETNSNNGEGASASYNYNEDGPRYSYTNSNDRGGAQIGSPNELTMKECYAILEDKEVTHEDIINMSEEEAKAKLKSNPKANKKKYWRLSQVYHTDKCVNAGEGVYAKHNEKSQNLNAVKERLVKVKEEEKVDVKEEEGYWP